MHIDKMIKRELMSIILTAVILLTVFIGVSFAVFFAIDEGEDTVIEIGDIDVTFCKDVSCGEAYANFGQIIGMEKDGEGNSVPSSIYPYTTTAKALESTPYIFNLKNTGDLKVYFSAYLKEDADFVPNESYSGYTSVTELYSNHIKVGIGHCDNGTPNTSDVEVFTYGSLSDGKIIDNLEMETGEEKTFCLWTWLDENTPNEVQETYFVANLNFTAEYVPYKPWYDSCDENSIDIKCKMLNAETAYADNINSTYVQNSPAGINFGAKNSDTNGKGLYYTTDATKTQNGERVYYYRGAVDNNFIVFANHCWRIVRTNEDGSVKLRYQAPATNTDGTYTCPMAAVATTTMAFNPSYDDVAYSGYMYPNTPTISSILNMDNDTLNANESPMKVYLDDWYDANLANYESNIADTIYCADRTISNGTNYNNYTNTKNPFGKNVVFYGAYERLAKESTDGNWYSNPNAAPQYKCERMEDSFTKSASIGNGKLEKAIGLITVDEAAYAGGLFVNTDGSSSNSDYYLYTNFYYWTMSPSYFNGSSATVFHVHTSGTFSNNHVHVTDGSALPAVSLTAETTVVSSGVGSATNPYVVE